MDIEGQFQVLLANSRLDEIANLGALADWEFYKSPIFYTLITVVVLTVSITALILTKGKNWCVIEKFIKKEGTPTKG